MSELLRRLGAVGRRLGLSPLLDRRNRRRARRERERWLARMARRDERWLSELAGRTDLRLNIGSSSSHLEGWISCDLLRDPDGVCLQMDATERWPFEDAAAEAVNSEHFIEHLTLEQARSYLHEARRVLRPGGLIRTSTPDLRGIAEAYVEGDPEKLAVHRSHGYQAATHGEMLNNYFYRWDHRHVYDFEGLKLLLEEAGFVDVERASFGRSAHTVLQGIDRHEPEGLDDLLLAVDAVNPATLTGQWHRRSQIPASGPAST